MDKKPTLRKAPIFIYLSIAIILVVCYFSFPEFKQGIDEAFDVITGEDEERLEAWVSAFGVLGPVVIILGMMVQMFLIVVPNFLLIMIAIVSYGPWWGSVIALIGVFAASSLGYLIGGKLSPVTLNKFVSTANQEKVGEYIHDYGIAVVMICRLCSFSNDAISFVAGILKMNYGKYILSSVTGITPLIVLLAIFGKNEKIEWALIWIAAASLVLLVGYIVLDRRRKRRKKVKS
jgi:uncharacterized membrane protein YdjX (TVP38/TMEM64 family)